MKRLTMLVTPDGRWVIEDSAEFLAALGDLKPDYDGASFAVKNLGFVRFQVLDQSVIEIELHPDNVELPGVAGGAAAVADLDGKVVPHPVSHDVVAIRNPVCAGSRGVTVVGIVRAAICASEQRQVYRRAARFTEIV